MRHPDFAAALDRLCPLHLWLDEGGVIRHAGPSLRKLRPERRWTDDAFGAVFRLQRPRGPRAAGPVLPEDRPLVLQFRDAPATTFKALAAPAPGGGQIVNLGFAMTMPEALAAYPLTSADFAATDPTVEMLFLIEAKSAAMDAQRHLNLRLQGARLAAEEQAQTDPLTGLRNLRGMRDVLSRLVATGTGFALMHVDLDHFKAVNDTYGHDAGDAVLREAARVMLSATRETDTVARMGGDEFLLVFPGLADRTRLAGIARRMIEGLERPVAVGDHLCRISASIGIVLSGDHTAPQIDPLLKAADLALYASKHAGRGRFSFETAPAVTTEAPRSPGPEAPSPAR